MWHVYSAEENLINPGERSERPKRDRSDTRRVGHEIRRVTRDGTDTRRDGHETGRTRDP